MSKPLLSHIYLFKFLLIFGLGSFGQVQNNAFKWACDYNHQAGFSPSRNTCDNNGNVIMTGILLGTMDMDPGPGVYNISSPTQQFGFVTKLDSLRNHLWSRQINFNSIVAVKTDPSGNVYMLGTFNLSRDMDPTSGFFPLTANGGNENMCIVKLDLNGNFVWARAIIGAGNDQPKDMAIDIAGNVFITGGFTGVQDFDVGPGTYTLSSSPSFDIFICKINMNGNFVWAKQVGNTGIDRGYALTLDNSANIFYSGSFSGTVDLDPGPTTVTYSAISNGNVFFSKLDSSGNFIWARHIVSSSNSGVASIALDNSNNIILAGVAYGINDFDVGPGTYSVNAWDKTYIAKYDLNTNFVFAKLLGGSHSHAACLVTDAGSNIYVVGEFAGVADMDPGPAQYTVVSGHVGSSYSDDIFVTKLNSLGNFVWTYCLGNTTMDNGMNLSIDMNSNLYVSGIFSNLVDFDLGIGVSNLTGNTAFTDYFLMRLQNCYAVNASVVQQDLNCWNEANASATITASGGSSPYTYSWSPGNMTTPVVNGLSFQTYTCTVVNACGNSDKKVVTITASYVSPTLNLTSSSSTFCAGQSITLTAVGATTYSWSSGPTSSSCVVTPSANITYSAIGTDSNNCVDTETISLSVGICAGIIENNNEDLQIDVFPNPVNDRLFFKEAVGKEMELNISVFDTKGKLLKEEKMKGNTGEINFKNYSSGLYLVQLRSGNSIRCYKIIKP